MLQSKSCGELGLFAIQQDQIILWDKNCNKTANTTVLSSSTAGKVSISITGATIGAEYVLSVKYDSKSIVGTKPANSPCIYTFVSQINGVNVAGSLGKIAVTKDCQVGTISAGSCPSPTIALTQKSNLENNDLSLNAYPNPYNSVVNFKFASPKSGKAVLEVFNILGQRVAIVYQGIVSADVPVSVKYNVPFLSRSTLIYKLTVDNKTIRGSVLPEKK